MTKLETIALQIVLETPRRSANAYQSYVRRTLIAELEYAGLKYMRERRRKDKAESDARIAAYKGEAPL